MRRPNSSAVLTIADPAHGPGHPRHRTRALLATVALTTSIVTALAAPAARATTALLGTLDTSFGVNGDGKVLHNMSSTSGHGGMAVQPDDSIIEVGGVGGRIVVDHFSADGALISSTQSVFGTDAWAVASLPAGGAVVVGQNGTHAVVARLTAAAVMGVPGTWEREITDMNVAQAVALTDDGDIFIGGQSSTGKPEIMRLNPDGSTDLAWGNSGTAIMDNAGHVHDIAFSNARYGGTVTAVTGSEIWVLDYGWWFGGVAPRGLPVTVPNTGSAHVNHLVLQPDGKILMAGRYGASSGKDGLWVARFASYRPDPTFGQGGFRQFDTGASPVSGPIDQGGLLLHPNGWIEASLSSADNSAFFVTRLGPNGEDGFRATTDMTPGSQETTVDLGRQSTGKIVVAGMTGTAFALARYLGQPTVQIDVSGSQAWGDTSPLLTERDDAPAGITVTGLSCTNTTVGAVSNRPPGTYTIDGSSCTATLSGPGASNYDLSFTGVNNGFSVIKRAASVTVTGNQAYGSSTPTFAATANGYLPVTVVGTVSCTKLADGTAIASTLSAGGTYTVDGTSCSGLTTSNPNYTVAYTGGTFSVTPASIPVTVSGSQTYGSSTPTFVSAASPPSGVTVVGTVSCTKLADGTAIASTLSAGGIYAIDGTSCTGLTTSDPNYAVAYTGGTFSVNRASQTIVFTSAPPTSAVVAGRYTVAASGGASGNPVVFSADGSSAGICTVSGATVDFVGAGTCVIDANQAGNDNFNPAAQSSQSFVVVAAIPTSLTYNGMASGDFHDSATLGARLVDANGKPISGQTVNFTMAAESCSAMTDATGEAVCSITASEAAGSYPVRAFFSGSTDYLASSTSAAFTVTNEQTALSYTGPRVVAAGLPVTLSGVLAEDGTTPIAGRTVSFTLGSGASAQTCTATTGASGAASCTIAAVAQPLGPGTVADSFAGDNFYEPSSAKATTILFAFAGRGAFVIGDTKAVDGAPVTFWGAQWMKLNTLSAGSAPAAFKGFAVNTTDPPSCGSNWTTAPPNSATPSPDRATPPAGPLPSYMAVIASSSITSSGSIISGNTAKIVVVRTDTGYQADPGHPGTGTVVASFC